MAFDLKSAVATLAPTLATMMGGPLAGAAVKALGEAFGLPNGATQDDVSAVLQRGALSGEMIAAVRAADQRHAEAMTAMGIDLARVNADTTKALAATDAADRDSARKRESTVGGVATPFLAGLITIGFFAVLAYIVGNGKPAVGGDVVLLLLGSLSAAWTAVVSYYFGSSASSARKDATIAAQTSAST